MLQKLIHLIADETCSSVSDLDASTRLDSVVADSLEMVSLLMEVQNQFGVKVTDEQITRIQTIEDLYDAIHDHVAA